MLSISNAQARASRYIWAGDALARCLAAADRATAQPWGVLAQEQGDHRQHSSRLLRAAVGYAFSDERDWYLRIKQQVDRRVVPSCA